MSQMSPMNPIRHTVALCFALAAAALLAGCERPPVDSVQSGYRGTGMEQVYNPRTLAKQLPLNQPPAPIASGAAEGPKAKDVYQNVKVLGNLSVGQFTAQMVAITAWVSPEQGCNYCHNPANMADESKYTKTVARRMIQMTQHINADWKAHVANTGVSCYTCHRGQPVPAQTWYQPLLQDKHADFMGNRNGQNAPAPQVNLSTLPNDPVTTYLQGNATIRVAAKTALPTGPSASIQATEGTYGLMIHMSQSLGVNCTYCHNTRSLGSWAESTPQRLTAWHGIRMVGDVNNDYLVPLQSTLPVTRLGPNGDAPLVSCTTCHQGVYKPLYGAPMVQDWPGLQAPVGGNLLPVAAMMASPAGLAPGAMAPAAIAPGGTAPGGTALPPPLSEGSRSVLYFDVGSPTLQAVQSAGLAALVAELKAKPAARATISGYHSASVTPAQNEELAKQRTFGVRDALVTAGIQSNRVVLGKPQQTAANIAGEDPASRRVEVTVR
ncbi:MAG: photosynthetic reaction center cytochrome c subunit [Rubrivivax sp.]|nr:photosynthetic reaction center cytochrome c subunit [Rubrivivax sp.]